MSYTFPGPEWLQAFETKLNADDRYAHIARNWEGDILFKIERSDGFPESMSLYLDLWHGKCRQSFIMDEDHRLEGDPAFVLAASYDNFARILEGKLDPMQAMLARKLRVQGSMAYMMRNVPVVLDFVRCAKEVTLAGMEAEG
ncbi:MAG: SCP2 sterol-binding domain-containing protein [Anaerolineales bacterium]